MSIANLFTNTVKSDQILNVNSVLNYDNILFSDLQIRDDGDNLLKTLYNAVTFLILDNSLLYTKIDFSQMGNLIIPNNTAYLQSQTDFFPITQITGDESYSTITRGLLDGIGLYPQLIIPNPASTNRLRIFKDNNEQQYNASEILNINNEVTFTFHTKN